MLFKKDKEGIINAVASRRNPFSASFGGRSRKGLPQRKDGGVSAGFTLVELMVTVGIFLFMTALVVAKYGSFNDGTLLTSMSYDVALTLRSAQSYGLNVQSYNSQNLFNYPYGIHFSSAAGSNNQMILFADVNVNNIYDSA